MGEVWRLPDDASRVRTYVYYLTDSKSFGALVLITILINTAVLLIQTLDDHTRIELGWWLSCLDYVFLAIYQLEFMLKFFALRFHYFASSWNRLDFAIVIITLIDFLLPIFLQNAAVLDVATLFKLVKVGRSIKAIRAIRVLRTIRFLKNLQAILRTVLKSVRALSTIAILFLLFWGMFAVIGRGLFAQLAPTKFGNLGYAFVTLFQLVTLDDWFAVYEAHDPSPDCENPQALAIVLILFMMIYIFLQYFIILNLIVAVIVDNFQRTLADAEDSEKTKSEGRRTAIFVNEKTKGSLNDEGSNDVSSGAGGNSVTTIEYPAIEEFYSEEEVPDARDRQLLHNFYNNLAMLEYNIHYSHVQQKLIDDMVDITVAIAEVPEDLI